MSNMTGMSMTVVAACTMALLIVPCEGGSAGAYRGDAAGIPGTAVFAVMSRPDQAWRSYAIHLGGGVVITPAHVAGDGGTLQFVVDHVAIRASAAFAGDPGRLDLTVLLAEDLPATAASIAICSTDGRPEQDVIVVSDKVASSALVSARLAARLARGGLARHRFVTTVSGIGPSGSAVVDPRQRCLLGMITHRITENGKEIARAYLPASVIRERYERALGTLGAGATRAP